MPSVVAYQFCGVKLAVNSHIQCRIVLSLTPCPTKLSLFSAIHLQRSHGFWSDMPDDSDDDWLSSMSGKQREVCFPLLAPEVFFFFLRLLLMPSTLVCTFFLGLGVSVSADGACAEGEVL